jgi:hypothetical protein
MLFIASAPGTVPVSWPENPGIVSTVRVDGNVHTLALSVPTQGRVAIGELPDGRLQIFEITSHGGLRSRWKISTDPNSAWTGWDYSSVPAPLQSIAVGKLPDRRLQLFAVDVNGVSWSKWKITTDPNSLWTDWSKS